MNDSSFYAGAAMTDITPPLGTLINGDFVSHYAREIHDPLYAKALVLQDSGTTLAFVIVDICVMQKGFIDEVKQDVFHCTGIEPQHIMIASTHTHAAGSIADLLLGAADLPYRTRLASLITEAVDAARKRLQPAKIGFGTVDVPEHVVCRRYRMQPGYRAYNPVTGALDKIKTNPLGDEDKIVARAGTPDPAVSYLAVKSADDNWIALLANYSMHYVGDWENGTITADYFGVFARQVKSLLQAGDDFVGIMSNGTSGDANIVDFLQPDRYPKEPFTKSELIGKDIAGQVFRSMKNISWQTNPVLSSSYQELAIGIRKPSEDELEDALSVVAGTKYEHLDMIESSHTGNEDAFKKIYAREQVLLHAYPNAISFPVQVFNIGPVSVGGLGAEIFSSTGLWLKQQRGGGKYFTICLANDCAGYVPPAEALEAGGYETWRCRSSCLEPGAEEKIKNNLLQLLTKEK